jgi:hypothetical protein
VALTVQIRVDEGSRRWRWFRLMGRPGRVAGCSENGQMLVGTLGTVGAQLARTGETALCRHGLAHRSSVASQQVLADETSSFIHTLEVWMRGRDGDAMEAWVSMRSGVECRRVRFLRQVGRCPIYELRWAVVLETRPPMQWLLISDYNERGSASLSMGRPIEQ